MRSDFAALLSSSARDDGTFQIQPGHDTLPWLISYSLDEYRRVMLRPQKFRPYERVILCCLGLLLLGAGLVGALIAFEAAYWRFAAVGVATIGLAVVYFLAAKRGKPL